MSVCEKCWRDAKNSPFGPVGEEYVALITQRVGPFACSPEQQAGPEAKRCEKCDRMTRHQFTRECMACEATFHEQGALVKQGEQPAADVQVCIGALLDAWDWLPNDVSQEPELETVRACMARLFAVVEGAAPDVQGADKLAGNSDVRGQIDAAYERGVADGLRKARS